MRRTASLRTAAHRYRVFERFEGVFLSHEHVDRLVIAEFDKRPGAHGLDFNSGRLSEQTLIHILWMTYVEGRYAWRRSPRSLSRSV